MIVDAGRQRIPMRRDAVDLAALARRLDLVLLLAAAALVGYGLWAVAGITRFDVPGDPGYYVTRQAIAAAVGGVGLVIAIVTPPSLYRRHWRVVYGVAIGLMLFVFVFAEAVRGSKRWIDIGPLQFQPSEFGKALFVLAIAGFLVERQREIGRIRTVATAIALGAAPIFLVFLQPDLGTALVYAAAFSAVLFVAGVRWLHLALLGGLAVTLVLGVLWFLPASGIEVLKPYQTARLTGLRESRRRSERPDVQRQAVDHRGRLRRARRTGCQRGEPDPVRLPPGARDRLRLRVVLRAARLLRRPRSSCSSTCSSSGGASA